MNKYNIYIDESSIDNPKNNYMVIGGIFLKRESKNFFKKAIKEIRKKHNYFSEIKWTKFNKKTIPFMKDIIDLFFEKENIDFYSIVIERSRVLYDVYHSWDKEVAFYKFIYQLLQNRFLNESIYYLFLDYKEIRKRDSLKELKNFLDIIIIRRKCINSKIQHLQHYNSKNIEFIQLADFFSWAIWYEKNWFWKSEAKKEIIKYIAKKLWKKDLNFKSNKEDKKFNIFKIWDYE